MTIVAAGERKDEAALSRKRFCPYTAYSKKARDRRSAPQGAARLSLARSDAQLLSNQSARRGRASKDNQDQINRA